MIRKKTRGRRQRRNKREKKEETDRYKANEDKKGRRKRTKS